MGFLSNSLSRVSQAVRSTASRVRGALFGQEKKPELLRPGQAESDAIRKQVNLFLKEREKIQKLKDAREAASRTAVPAQDWMFEPKEPVYREGNRRGMTAKEQASIEDLLEPERKPIAEVAALRMFSKKITSERQRLRGANYTFEDLLEPEQKPKPHTRPIITEERVRPNPKPGRAEVAGLKRAARKLSFERTRTFKANPVARAKGYSGEDLFEPQAKKAVNWQEGTGGQASQAVVSVGQRKPIEKVAPLRAALGQAAAGKQAVPSGAVAVSRKHPNEAVAALAGVYESHGIPADHAPVSFRPLSVVLKGKPETDAVFTLIEHLKSMGASPGSISALRTYFRFRRAGEDALSEGSRRFTAGVNAGRRDIADAGNDMLLGKKAADTTYAATAPQPLVSGNLVPYAGYQFPESVSRAEHERNRLERAVLRFNQAKNGRSAIDAKTRKELERINEKWDNASKSFTPKDSERLESARQFIDVVRHGHAAVQQALLAEDNRKEKDAAPFFDREIATTSHSNYSAPIVDDKGFRHIPPARKAKGPNGVTTIRRME